jgi:hypothetical protein
MNFLPGKRAGDEVDVGEGVRVPLPAELRGKAGDAVTVGVRPEHLRGERRRRPAFSLRVDTVEALGADSLLHCASARPLVVRVDGHETPSPARALRVRDARQDLLLRHGFRQAAVTPDARRLEELSLNSSAPPGQLLYDGWLLRLLPGKAKRPRSVNAVYASTLALDDKIAYCERLYGAARLPALFRITPFCDPRASTAELERRGYGRFDDDVGAKRAIAPSATAAPEPR